MLQIKIEYFLLNNFPMYPISLDKLILIYTTEKKHTTQEEKLVQHVVDEFTANSSNTILKKE